MEATQCRYSICACQSVSWIQSNILLKATVFINWENAKYLHRSKYDITLSSINHGDRSSNFRRWYAIQIKSLPRTSTLTLTARNRHFRKRRASCTFHHAMIASLPIDLHTVARGSSSANPQSEGHLLQILEVCKVFGKDSRECRPLLGRFWIWKIS
jgi:hypothetical protein